MHEELMKREERKAAVACITRNNKDIESCISAPQSHQKTNVKAATAEVSIDSHSKKELRHSLETGSGLQVSEQLIEQMKQQKL